MNTLRFSEILEKLIKSTAEATRQFEAIAYEFRFIRDHFPMCVNGYPPRKPNRTRKRQRLNRLVRRRQRQQRTR